MGKGGVGHATEAPVVCTPLTTEGKPWCGTAEELRVLAANHFQDQRPVTYFNDPPTQAVPDKELPEAGQRLLSAAGYENFRVDHDQLLGEVQRFKAGDILWVPPGTAKAREAYAEAHAARQKGDSTAVTRYWANRPAATASPTYVPDRAGFLSRAQTLFDRFPVGKGGAFLILPDKFIPDSALTSGQRFTLTMAGPRDDDDGFRQGFRSIRAGQLNPQPAGVDSNAILWISPSTANRLGLKGPDVPEE